jgi:hypothetical protein
MGVAASFLAVDFVELVEEATMTVAEIAEEIVDEVIAQVEETLEWLEDSLDTIASRSWSELYKDGFKKLLSEYSDMSDTVNSIKAARTGIQQTLKKVMQKATNPQKSWQDFKSTLKDAKTSMVKPSDAEDAESSMSKAIGKICNAGTVTADISTDAQSVLGELAAVSEQLKLVHTCGGSALVKEARQQAITDFQTLQQHTTTMLTWTPSDLTTRLKMKAGSYSTAILKQAIMKHVSAPGKSCFAAYQQDPVGTVNGVAKEIKSSKTVKKVAGNTGHTLTCTVDLTGSDTYKCPAAKQNQVSPPPFGPTNPCAGSGRRLSETVNESLYFEEGTNSTTYGIIYPQRMYCADEGFKTVNTSFEAASCSARVMRETYIDWRHSNQYGLLPSCDTILYAGTENIEDEFCNVFVKNTSDYYVVNHFGRRTYYSSQIECASHSQYVHTLQTAMSSARPEMIKFLWNDATLDCAWDPTSIYLQRPAMYFSPPSARVDLRILLLTTGVIGGLALLHVLLHLFHIRLLVFQRTPPSSRPRPPSATTSVVELEETLRRRIR